METTTTKNGVVKKKAPKESKANNIYTKLLAFQKLGISVKKDGTNPHFKSSYATLNEVLDKVKKPLNDLGILITFEPQPEGLKTVLLCTESNTAVTSFMKYVNCETPQKLLSCNTYFRRGSLVALLGLEDEDDDGNQASARQKQGKTKEELIKAISIAKSREILTNIWNMLGPEAQANSEVVNAFAARGKELETQTKNK